MKTNNFTIRSIFAEASAISDAEIGHIIDRAFHDASMICPNCIFLQHVAEFYHILSEYTENYDTIDAGTRSRLNAIWPCSQCKKIYDPTNFSSRNRCSDPFNPKSQEFLNYVV